MHVVCIHSFILNIYIAPLLGSYSEVLPMPALLKGTVPVYIFMYASTGIYFLCMPVCIFYACLYVFFMHSCMYFYAYLYVFGTHTCMYFVCRYLYVYV